MIFESVLNFNDRIRSYSYHSDCASAVRISTIPDICWSRSNLDTSKTIFVLTIWYLFMSKITLISNHTYFYSFILCALVWFSKFQKSIDKQNNNNKLLTRAAELARRHKKYVYRFPYGHHIFTKLNSCFIKTIWFLCNDVRVIHESYIATHPSDRNL